MDGPHRRPPRAHPHPATTGAPPRRPLFHTGTATSSHTSRANSRTAATKSNPVHIPADPPSVPERELVERDASGNYKIMAPTAAMRMSVEKPMSAEEEEKEQEDHMISLFGRNNCHWDQTGKVVHRYHTRDDLDGMIGKFDKTCVDEEHVDFVWKEDWEDDGWGYWDAETRCELHETRRKEEADGLGFHEREGWCHWTFKFNQHLWCDTDHCTAVMEDVRDALRSSLDRAAAGLEADKWMFEGDIGRKS